MRRGGLGILLALVAGCAGGAGGGRAADYLPLQDPWTGLFNRADRDPCRLSIRPAAPKGRVWLIDLSAFYDGGQYGLLVTSGESGILLHDVLLAGALVRLDAAQVFLPRDLSSGAGWRSSGSDVEIQGAEAPEEARPTGRRKVEVRTRLKSQTTSFTFWLERGAGIARFEGGAGDLRGVWDQASVLKDPR